MFVSDREYRHDEGDLLSAFVPFALFSEMVLKKQGKFDDMQNCPYCR